MDIIFLWKTWLMQLYIIVSNKQKYKNRNQHFFQMNSIQFSNTINKKIKIMEPYKKLIKI